MNAPVEDALQFISEITGIQPSEESGPGSLGERVAQVLGWKQGRAHLEDLTGGRDDIKLARANIGPQRAAVFAQNGAATANNLLPDAALFAYLSTVHWGVVLDVEGVIVFNSHWIRDDEWYRLQEVRWEDLREHRDLIKALTPDGVAAGHLDRIAAFTVQPERVLTPVDDALVKQLENWRREALRYGHDSTNLDADLHTLFAQLFVLRAVEDRALALSVPPLSKVLREDGADLKELEKIFKYARRYIRSELFKSDSYKKFPGFIVSGIILDLYRPSQLSESSRRYNFAWIDADILGRAYEKYLSNIFMPTPPSPQMSLFYQPVREVEPVNVKKSGGVFYTPDYLVGTLTHESILDAFEKISDPEFIPRIADFACGSGSFLVAAVENLLRILRKRDSSRNWARTLVEGRYVIGIDIDPRAVTLSRMNLWIRLTDEPDALPLPSIENCVVLGDSLGTEVWEKLPEKYDVVLGNPPFIASGSRRPREELERSFRTARGRYDYAYLFVELAVDKLNSNGTMGMVVPNRLFRNQDAGIVRSLLSDETALLTIVDFGATEVFRGTSAYIGAIIARRCGSPACVTRDNVRVIVISNVSDTRYLAGTILKAISSEGEYRDDSVAGFDIPAPEGAQPWLMIPPSDLRARIRLEDASVSLGEIARIIQGIRTGANDIFIVTMLSSDGSVASVVDGFGKPAILETTLLHPVVFGTDIQRYAPLPSGKLLLYPYDRGRVIPETEMREEFPHTFRYLSAYQDLLSSRTSIAGSSLRWYELVRRRDEEWLNSRKLLTRDLATRTSFTLDDAGEIILVGGTAVVPPSVELALPLLAYINSDMANRYLSEVTPVFRGSFQKLEPQHLERLPVPNAIAELSDSALDLGELARRILIGNLESRTEDVSMMEAEIDELLEDLIISE